LGELEHLNSPLAEISSTPFRADERLAVGNQAYSDREHTKIRIRVSAARRMGDDVAKREAKKKAAGGRPESTVALDGVTCRGRVAL
jgi:hypothetical protein